MIEVTINNKKYNVENNLTVLQACEQANAIVPRFCYHEKLSVAGNCRMCIVEIEKSPKPVASCATPLMPNMVIYTDTPLVKKAREAVLEFLLINHPLDCPICDQGGECDLQDITLNYGSDRSRFFEFKRGVEDKECGPIIKTIMTRCIHCTRCVRFIAEIAGTGDLGTICRGENTEIGTYINKFLKTELSGNLVDLCPVGALTSKPYAFSARTWELKKFESIDFTDSLCSNIIVYTRNNMPNKHYDFKYDFENKDQIMRILPKLNNNINENWISDKTRYAFDGFSFNRLKQIKKKSLNKANKKKNQSWSNFLYDFTKEFNFNLSKNSNILGIIGPNNDIESIYFLNKILKLAGSNNIQVGDTFSYYNVDAPCFYQFNSTLRSIDESDAILLIGINPRYEASMLNVRIRKQYMQKQIPIGLIGAPVDLTYPVHHLGSSTKTLINITEGRNFFCKYLRNAKKPLIIVGNEINKRKDSKALLNLIYFLSKKSILNLKTFNGLNFVHPNISQINACELGIAPGKNSPLHKGVNNNYDFSFLLNTNGVNKNILNKKNKIYSFNTHKLEENSENVSYQIPITGHYEKDSFVINTEGTVQKAFKSVSPFKDARNSEDIFKVIGKFNNKVSTFTSKNLIKEVPFLNSFNHKREKFYFNFLNKNEFKNKIYLSNFKNAVDNFYMTDLVTKNSQVMAECSLFLKNKTNFIKNCK